MTLPVKIEGHDHANSTVTAARVTRTGQLVTAPFAYDLTSFAKLETADAAVNYYEPLPHKQFVITGVVATANKQVGPTEDAVIAVFEASNETTSSQDKVLLTLVLTQSQVVSVLPLNIIVTEGKFVNAETDNDDVYINITGYYIPAL